MRVERRPLPEMVKRSPLRHAPWRGDHVVGSSAISWPVDSGTDVGPRLLVDEHPMVSDGQDTGPAQCLGSTGLHLDGRLGSPSGLTRPSE
jgi:hypothetical protein